MTVRASNNLGREFAQSDSLLTRAFRLRPCSKRCSIKAFTLLLLFLLLCLGPLMVKGNYMLILRYCFSVVVFCNSLNYGLK